MMVKHLHLTFVALTFISFSARFILSQTCPSKMPTGRWFKILPHAIDTLLLISGITLAVILHQYPFVDMWITAKLGALLLYIALGFVALKLKFNTTLRLLAGLAAWVVFFYMVLVAHHKVANILNVF